MASFIRTGLGITLLCAVLASGASDTVAGDEQVEIHPDAKSIDAYTWAHMIDHSAQQAMLSQEIAKEFFQIASGISPEKSRENMTHHIHLFEEVLFHLKNGTEERHYALPPSQLVADALIYVTSYWPTFKDELELNMHIVSPSDHAVLEHIMTKSVALMHAAEGVEEKYADAAKAVGADVAGLTLTIAARQRMLTQEMAKEALLIGLNIEKDTNMERLAHSVRIFDASHEGLLRGARFAGVQALTSMCTLWQMSRVTAKWEEMEPVVMRILDYGVANDETLRQLAVLNMVMLKEMEKAVEYYIEDDGTCTYAAGIDKYGWTKLMKMGGEQRMLGQKASRLFYQVARGIKVTESQVDLSTTLSGASSSLRLLIEGSQNDNIPAPPTQEIATQLTDVWAGWKNFDAMLTTYGNTGKVSAEVLLRSATMSRDVLTGMNGAVNMMTEECVRVMPIVHPVEINIAEMQLKLMEQMSKETILVVKEYELNLISEAEHNKVAVESTIKAWLDAHWILLLGREAGDAEACKAHAVECTDTSEPATNDAGGHRRLAGSSAPAPTPACAPNDAGGHRRLAGSCEVDAMKLYATHDVCVLRSMKHALDTFNDLMPKCREVAARSLWMTRSEVDHMLEEIHELNEPASHAMHHAVDLFASNEHHCDLDLSLNEWQQVFMRMGRAELIIEDLVTEYLFEAIGDIVHHDSEAEQGALRRLEEGEEEDGQVEEGKVHSMMAANIHELDEMLFLLKYGNETLHVSTPPSEHIAELLFNLTDDWEHLKALLTAPVDRAEAGDLLELSTHMSHLAAQTMHLYEEEAMHFNNQSGWKTIGRVSQEPATLTRLVRDAALLSFPSCETCIAQGKMLATSISDFDALVRMPRRMAAVAAVSGSSEHNAQVADAQEKFVRQWDVLKPTLESAFASFNELQTVPEASLLARASLQASVARDAAAKTVDVLISLTQTTTRIPLDILVPLPMTGAWDAGESMRVAILLAEDIINTQQKILPGYTLVSHFVDDQCDDERVVQLVLDYQSHHSDLIALGGVGCQASCEALARVAPAMLVPFLSYSCPGRRLSDNTTFKNFARMGNNMYATPAIMKALADNFGWAKVAMVVGDQTKYGEEAHALEKKLQDKGLDVVYMAEDKGDSFTQTRALAEDFKSAKERVLFMVGDESFKRRVVCASRVVGANLGITWITEGAHSHGWLVHADEKITEAECTPFNMEESFDGALNIVDSDTPLDGEEELPLDCFEDETSKSFLALAEKHAVEGFPAGDNTTSVQKRFDVFGKAADGACAMALAMRHVLSTGVSAEELRQPSEEIYAALHHALREDTDFRGASGHVHFDGNDEIGHILIQQRRANADEETKDSMPWVDTTVGIQFYNGTLMLEMNGGLSDAAYQEATQEVEAEFPFAALQVSLVILFICCPFCIALCYVWNRHSAKSKADAHGGPAKGEV